MLINKNALYTHTPIFVIKKIDKKMFNKILISIIIFFPFSKILAQDTELIEQDSIQNILITETETYESKPINNFNIGIAASAGLLKGESFSGGLPVGGTLVLTTPFGFKVGPFNYTVSLGLGSYSASSENVDGSKEEFNPSFLGLGGNLTIANLVFAEGHLGVVGEGSGFRGFAGITLERLMKKGLNLPVNLLVGSEAFYSTDMAGVGNPSGWAALGVRASYSF